MTFIGRKDAIYRVSDLMPEARAEKRRDKSRLYDQSFP